MLNSVTRRSEWDRTAQTFRGIRDWAIALEPVTHTADGFDKRKIRVIGTFQPNSDPLDADIDHVGFRVEVDFPNIL